MASASWWLLSLKGGSQGSRASTSLKCSICYNFLRELRRIPLPRTSVNSPSMADASGLDSCDHVALGKNKWARRDASSGVHVVFLANRAHREVRGDRAILPGRHGSPADSTGARRGRIRLPRRRRGGGVEP